MRIGEQSKTFGIRAGITRVRHAKEGFGVAVCPHSSVGPLPLSCLGPLSYVGPLSSVGPFCSVGPHL